MAKSILQRSSIRIPIPRRKILYINPASDFFSITKMDVNMDVQILDFIVDPALVGPLAISGITVDNMGLKKSMMHYFDQFSPLKERECTDYGSQSENMSHLIQQI